MLEPLATQEEDICLTVKFSGKYMVVFTGFYATV